MLNAYLILNYASSEVRPGKYTVSVLLKSQLRIGLASLSVSRVDTGRRANRIPDFGPMEKG